MIELLLPLNTIRHKYGMPERAGCGEVDHELLQMLAEQDRKQKQQRKQQRTRSVGVPPLPPLAPPPARHQKSRSVDNTWPIAEQASAVAGAGGSEKTAETRVEGGEGGEGGGRPGEIEAAGAEAVGGEQRPAGAVGHAAVEEDGGAVAAAGDGGTALAYCTADGAAEDGHDTTFGAGDADGGMMSIISQLMGDQDAPFCVNTGEEQLEAKSTTNKNCNQQLPPSGFDDVDGSKQPVVPEIRVGEGHDHCTAPTSADSSAETPETPETPGTESASPVGHSEGQGHMSPPDTADLQRTAGVTPTDGVSVADSGLTPEDRTNPTQMGPTGVSTLESEPEVKSESVLEQEPESAAELKLESDSQQEEELEHERAEPEADTEREPERKPVNATDLASSEFGGSSLQSSQNGPVEVAAR